MTKLKRLRGNGADMDLLRGTFPGLRHVLLTRRDKARQTMSYYRAIKTGVWWSIRPDANANEYTPTPQESVVPLFDFQTIDHWVKHLTEFESNWRQHFARLGVKPFEVAYEDFVENYESTVFAILDYLGIPIAEGR